ncbi:MAG: carbon-nitrogen hydrolase family protein [Planctomycetes bacterium]|nr:carbon-nitrogen hydrolase family protein [Planctomycetota bacterium]
MKTFRACAASIPACWGRTDANLAKVARAVEEAAGKDARLVLLPECSLTGADWPTGASEPRLDDVALELDSAPLREIRALARRTGIVIVPGFYEKTAGRIHVSQAVIAPDGILGVYRKVHEGSRSSLDAELFPVFDVGFARVGISICMDNMLPECARALAINGAEVLLAPFASLPLSRKGWRANRLLPLRARALDNRMFVLSASHAQPHVRGRPGEWGYSGICCAVSPLGEVVAESRGRAGTPQNICVDLDAALLDTYLLADVPGMRVRRPGAYGVLADPEAQERYLRNAGEFRYNDSADRMTLRPIRRPRT